MRSRHVAIVAVSVAAVVGSGWATVWRDRPSEPVPVPPIEIAFDEDGSSRGQNAKQPERKNQEGGAEDPQGSGASSGGAEPVPLPPPPGAGDDDVRNDGGDDDD